MILAADQLVLPESSDQLFPVPRGKHRRHSPVPGPAVVADLQTAACTRITFRSPRFIRTGHTCNTRIGLDALLKLLVDLNHRIADLVDLIAFPRDGQEHLPPPTPSGPCSNVQPSMTTVVEHRPATAAALLRQGVRHNRPDRVLPVTGRRHVRRLVRCFISQPCKGNQGLAEAGSPNANRSKGFEPKTLIEKSKRAAGIEPASSAWKAEVLPLNYARIN